MKVSELTGVLLDFWVEKAEGNHIHTTPDQIPHYEFTAYSTNWAEGGPIIERENIGLFPSVTFGYPGSPYHARIYNPRAGKDVYQTGNTPLEAAMRCYVASKFSAEVPDK